MTNWQIEHPYLTATLLAQAAAQDTGNQKPYLQFVIRPPDSFPQPGVGWFDQPLALPRGIAEVFAYRLAGHVGVLVPNVRLQPDEPNSFTDYVKKVEGRWVISERIPCSLPLYYFPKGGPVLPPDLLTPSNRLEEDGFLHWKFVRESIDKRCPVDRSSYSDFPDPVPIQLQQAAKWDSPARLLGHAFRAFLYVTYAHTSNCLMDIESRLWHIDHEKIAYREDAEDIFALYQLVEGSDRVMKACRRLCRITPSHLWRALDGFSKRYWRDKTEIPYGALDGQKAAHRYFTRRLEIWQKCFASAHAVVSSHKGRAEKHLSSHE